MWTRCRAETAIAVLGWLGLAQPGRGQTAMQRADEQFEVGNFVHAAALYQEAVARGASPGATLRLGEIALLSNRFDEAERHLRAATAAGAEKRRTDALLAEVFQRRDDLLGAASYYRSAGREPAAKQAESFRHGKPYAIQGGGASTRIPFVHVDPLPLLTAKITGPNGKTEMANLILDTGGGHLILDPTLADALELPRFGSETSSTFAGDRSANVECSRVESIQLGEFTVQHVPTSLLDTKKINQAANGKTVHGVLGTILLYHFVTTIDYPKGELVLSKRRAGGTDQAPPAVVGGTSHSMPFWLAGDHLMVTWGQVARCSPAIMLLDTGLAGGAFTAPNSTLQAAGIDLASAPVFQGAGGGGSVDVRPFVLDELSLGEVKRTKLTSFAGPFPEPMEHKMGFRIGGLVSHGFLRPYAVTLDFDAMRLTLRSTN